MLPALRWLSTTSRFSRSGVLRNLVPVVQHSRNNVVLGPSYVLLYTWRLQAATGNAIDYFQCQVSETRLLAEATIQRYERYKSCKNTNEGNPSCITPRIPHQIDAYEPTTNTHQIIVRLPILASLKILSLRRYKVSILKGDVGESSLTSIRPSIRFLISMGFGWNRGMSCRVTSLIRSLWAMRFLSFMILTIHAYGPPVRSFIPRGASTLPLFGVFVPHRSCHGSLSALQCFQLSTRPY